MSTPIDAAWDLLERIPPAVRLEEDAPDRVAGELARLPVPRIVEFHLGLVTLADRALRWDVWEAADLISREELSLDSYQDFRMWLIMLGRDAFEAALTDPDSLAGHPAVQALAADAELGPPLCQDLAVVAEMAVDRMLDELGPQAAETIDLPAELELSPGEAPDDPAPAGIGSAEGLAERLPRLVRLFGIPPYAAA